jgi:hypothetical protein
MPHLDILQIGSRKWDKNVNQFSNALEDLTNEHQFMLPSVPNVCPARYIFHPELFFSQQNFVEIIFQQKKEKIMNNKLNS